MRRAAAGTFDSGRQPRSDGWVLHGCGFAMVTAHRPPLKIPGGLIEYG